MRYLRAIGGLRTIAAAAFLALLVAGGHGRADGRSQGSAGSTAAVSASLAGQLLVASAKMDDPRFVKTVIYIVASDADGAMGLVVNRAYGEGPLAALLAGFGIKSVVPGRGPGREPQGRETQGREPGRDPVRLHYGGPVDGGRGFVLHSREYQGSSTRSLADGLALSTGRDVLEAVAAGKGPQRRLFALGYAGWGPGQIEDELSRGEWLTAPADEALIFADDLDRIWERAMRLAGLAL